MEIKLHANATTTPRTRKYLQESTNSDRELAQELGISITTVRRWRNRRQISDNHTTRHRIPASETHLTRPTKREVDGQNENLKQHDQNRTTGLPRLESTRTTEDRTEEYE